MDKLKYTRLPATTLIETIIALVIILVIFGIVTTFLVQISVNSFSLQQVKAIQLIDDYASETNEQKAFFDEEKIAKDDTYIKREISDYNGNTKLVKVTFRVFDRSHKLITLQDRLFYLK